MGKLEDELRSGVRGSDEVEAGVEAEVRAKVEADVEAEVMRRRMRKKGEIGGGSE